MIFVDIFRKDLRNALSKGVFHMFVSLAFSQGIMLLLGIFLARLLKPENLGHVKFIQSVMQFAAVPAAFGMASAIAKYTSEFQLEELKKKVLSQGMFFSIFTASLAAFGVFLLSQSTRLINDSVARYYLRFMCWSLPFTIVTSNILCNFQGRKQIKRMSMTGIVLRSFLFTAVCTLTYLWMLRGYAIAKIGYDVVSSLTLLWLIRKSMVLEWDKELFRKMLRFGSFRLLGGTFSAMILNVDILCISNILKDSALVGYYGIAATMARGLMIIPNSVTQTAFPYLSERSQNFPEVWRQLWRLAWKVACLMAAVCILGFVSAHWIVHLLFGREYLPSASVLQVLMPGVFIYSLVNVSGNTMLAIGRTDIGFYITFITGVFNVAMNILLVRRLGIAGAAYSTVLTYALNLILQSVFWLKQLSKWRSASLR